MFNRLSFNQLPFNRLAGEQIEATGKASLSTEINVSLSKGKTEQSTGKASLNPK